MKEFEALFDTFREEALEFYNNRDTAEAHADIPTVNTPLGSLVRYRDGEEDDWMDGQFIAMTESGTYPYAVVVIEGGVIYQDDSVRFCELLPTTQD